LFRTSSAPYACAHKAKRGVAAAMDRPSNYLLAVNFLVVTTTPTLETVIA
jgi:hypothetical protein